MAPGRADTLRLKQILLIFSVEQPFTRIFISLVKTITNFRLIWFEKTNSKTKISLLDLKVSPIQTEGN